MKRLKEGSILEFFNLFYIKNIFVENTEEGKALEVWSKANE